MDDRIRLHVRCAEHKASKRILEIKKRLDNEKRKVAELKARVRKLSRMARMLEIVDRNVGFIHDDDLPLIAELHKSGMSVDVIAEKFDVDIVAAAIAVTMADKQHG